MDDKRYKAVKWCWLVTQSVMPIIAVFYLARVPIDTLPFGSCWLSVLEPVFPILIAPYVILWLIGESVLMMYRFPLALRDAIVVLGGFLAQHILILSCSGSVTYSAFVSVYTTMVALCVCILLLMGNAVIRRFHRRDNAARWFCLSLPAALLVAAPLVALFPFAWVGMDDQGTVLRAANGFALLNTVQATVRKLVGVSIWGAKDDADRNYAEEWNRWAAPTIGILICCVTAAAIIGGIMMSA